MTTMNVTGRHWNSNARVTIATVMTQYVTFGLRWLLGLESKAPVGQHAQRGGRAPGWVELTTHYVVALVTWTRSRKDEYSEYTDESALSRTGRVLLAFVVLACALGVPWLVGGSA